MSSAVPVTESARVDAVDAARGLALLGIFCVNIQLFAEPFGKMMTPPGDVGLTDTIAHYFVAIFCTGKFYGLFSLLFGVGFALQRSRVLDRGVSFTGVYVRRIVFLAAVGFLHAMLIWYGDILFIYAMVAVVLLIFGGISPKAKAIAAACLLGLYALFASPLAGLQEPGGATKVTAEAPPAGTPGETTPETPVAAAGDSPSVTQEPETAPTIEPPPPRAEFWETPFGQLIDGFKHGRITDPTNREWQSLERGVYQEGPYGQLFLFRAFTWAMMIVWSVFTGFDLSVLAMFFIGASLAGSNSLGGDKSGLHKRFVLIGGLIGLPLAAFSAYAMGEHMASAPWRIAGTFSAITGAPLMSLGYLGAVLLAVNSGVAGAAGRALMATGRMALTNYLTQSLVATSVFYYYGLGWFGTVGQARQLLFVALVFACQVAISVLWMKYFRFGPMEWLWRSFTYLKAQPMRRVVTGD